MSRYSKWAKKEYGEGTRLTALLSAGILFLILIPYLLLVVSPSLDARLGLDLLNPSPASLMIGAILVVVGLFFGLWSNLVVFTHGRGTALPMLPTQRLVTTGPYQYCRNPMTLGTILAYLGLGIAAATIKEYDFMKADVTIRNETSADVRAIGEVTVAAFKTLEISNHTEQFISFDGNMPQGTVTFHEGFKVDGQ